MAYYDPLITRWAELDASQTVAERLTTINTASVDGPHRDVPVSTVVGYLALRGKLAALKAEPLAADFITLISTPSLTTFATSDATTYGVIASTLAAFVAGSLLTQDDADGLLAFTNTTIPWWQSVGLHSPQNEHDLVAAGIITEQDAVDLGVLGEVS